MNQISDINTYTSRMSKSCYDKLFFMNKISDVKNIVDFGCADGILIREMNKVMPDVKYIGYANNPRPIKMLAGIKTVNEYYGEYGEGPTGTYKITYKINDDVVSSFNQEYLTKIANGFINRITQDNSLISICNKCKYYEWTHTICIYWVSEKDMEKSELIREFKVFDMELLMLKSNNFTTIMNACKMACRDQGQYHWIKEKGTENDEKKSNYYWYDKTGKKEEK